MTKDSVYWNRIGLVQHKDYDFSIEKTKGIADLDAYTDEDWERYGDNIALAEVDSAEWTEWISANWDEELFRRRMNYTKPSYQNEQNILWFATLNWEFNRERYEQQINAYWEKEARGKNYE